jgi:hypothetical protein
MALAERDRGMSESTSDTPIPGSRKGSRWTRIVLLAIGLAAAGSTAAVLPDWLAVVTPRPLVRGLVVALAYTLIFIQLIVYLVAPIGLVVSLRRILQALRQRRAWVKPARVFLVCGSALFALLAGEMLAGARLAQLHRIPSLPTAFPQSRLKSNRDPISIVVIGESSAQGEPYHPWLSVGQIAAWRMQSVFPTRKVEVKVLAAGGFCLEQSILRLFELEERPDAIIVYSGHNEFQTRYGWDRNGAHYKGESTPKSILHRSVESLARLSNITALARDVIDRQRVDVMPLLWATRELIDHPAFSPDEYNFLREDFHRRLEFVVSYCETVGALPILIIPPSNDADYPPNRSYLSADSSAEDRERFAKGFRTLVDEEKSDPQAAVAAYRELLKWQPRFAESHYRLARLLEASGQAQEARRHYAEARDCDGMPMRCPSDFREAYAQVRGRHPGALVIDGEEILRPLSPRKQLDGTLFHDGQHPNLRSYTALANHLLERLAERGAFGWPIGAPIPTARPREVADQFGMNPERWAKVCEREADFYRRTAFLRFDPSVALEKAAFYEKAKARVLDGDDPVALGLGALDFPRDEEG